MHATPIQTDRVPGPRTTTPRPNPTGRPPLKREFEESEPNVTQQNHRQATPPAVTANGMNGIRPRPTKKQRMVRFLLSLHMVSQRDLHRCQRMPLRRETPHYINNTLHRDFELISLPLLPSIRLLHLSNIPVLVSVNNHRFTENCARVIALAQSATRRRRDVIIHVNDE